MSTTIVAQVLFPDRQGVDRPGAREDEMEEAPSFFDDGPAMGALKRWELTPTGKRERENHPARLDEIIARVFAYENSLTKRDISYLAALERELGLDAVAMHLARVSTAYAYR